MSGLPIVRHFMRIKYYFAISDQLIYEKKKTHKVTLRIKRGCKTVQSTSLMGMDHLCVVKVICNKAGQAAGISLTLSQW